MNVTAVPGPATPLGERRPRGRSARRAASGHQRAGPAGHRAPGAVARAAATASSARDDEGSARRRPARAPTGTHVSLEQPWVGLAGGHRERHRHGRHVAGISACDTITRPPPRRVTVPSPVGRPAGLRSRPDGATATVAAIPREERESGASTRSCGQAAMALAPRNSAGCAATRRGPALVRPASQRPR